MKGLRIAFLVSPQAGHEAFCDGVLFLKMPYIAPERPLGQFQVVYGSIPLSRNPLFSLQFLDFGPSIDHPSDANTGQVLCSHRKVVVEKECSAATLEHKNTRDFKSQAGTGIMIGH